MRTLLLLSLPALTLVAQPPLEVKAPITRVRVHPDEAWITRVGSLRLEQGGTYRLEVRGLPANLRMEDLKVTAKAPEGSRIGDISLGADEVAADLSPRQKELTAQLTQLHEQRDQKEAQRGALKEELEFLRRAMNAQADGNKDKPGALTAVMDLGKGLQTRMAELLLQDRKAKAELDVLAGVEGTAEKQLAALHMEASRVASRLAVELNASRGGLVELTLVNRSNEARWKPDYEARLGPEHKTLELVLFASVSQRTSEDWTQIPLELSTTRLQHKTVVPAFQGPVQVGWTQPEERTRYQPAPPPVGSDMVPEVAASRLPSADTFRYAQKAASEPAPVQALEAVAAVLEHTQGLGITFLLDGPKTVPADAQPHRLRVTGLEIVPELALVTCPRLDPTVYQMVRFQSPKDLPLFPGAPLRPFADGQRLPETRLAPPRPGQPFEFSLGAFEGLRVSLERGEEKNPFRLTRTVTHRKNTADGVEVRTEQVVAPGKDRVWTLGEHLALTNDLAAACTVEVLDRIVTSTQPRVTMAFQAKPEPDKTSPAPFLRRWTVLVAPGATFDLAMNLAVTGPREGTLTGLGQLGFTEE